MSERGNLTPIKAIDEYFDMLTKSRFIELFGDLESNSMGWVLSKLSNVAEEPLQYGSTASAVDYDGEVRYVRITDIDEDGHLSQDFKSPSKFNERYVLSKGDILFARSGSIGLTYEYREDYTSIFAGYLIKFKPDRLKLNPTFVYHFTRTDYCQSILLNSKRGGVQKNINAKQLNEIIIPIPPLDIQNQFVEFVELVNSVKTNCEQIFHSFDTLIKSKFMDMFAEDTGNHYLTCKIAEMLTRVYGGGTPSKSNPEYYDGDIPWVTSKDVKQFYIADSEIHITEQGLENSAAKIVPPNSIILVVRSGILKHTLPISVTTREVSINQDLKGLIVHSETNPIYLAYALKNQEDNILGSSKATTVDNIKIKNIQEIEVPNPPKNIQDQFADFVKEVDGLRFEIIRTLNKLLDLHECASSLDLRRREV